MTQIDISKSLSFNNRSLCSKVAPKTFEINNIQPFLSINKNFSCNDVLKKENISAYTLDTSIKRNDSVVPSDAFDNLKVEPSKHTMNSFSNNEEDENDLMRDDDLLADDYIYPTKSCWPLLDESHDIVDDDFNEFGHVKTFRFAPKEHNAKKNYESSNDNTNDKITISSISSIKRNTISASIFTTFGSQGNDVQAGINETSINNINSPAQVGKFNSINSEVKTPKVSHSQPPPINDTCKSTADKQYRDRIANNSPPPPILKPQISLNNKAHRQNVHLHSSNVKINDKPITNNSHIIQQTPQISANNHKITSPKSTAKSDVSKKRIKDYLELASQNFDNYNKKDANNNINSNVKIKSTLNTEYNSFNAASLPKNQLLENSKTEQHTHPNGYLQPPILQNPYPSKSLKNQQSSARVHNHSYSNYMIPDPNKGFTNQNYVQNLPTQQHQNTQLHLHHKNKRQNSTPQLNEQSMFNYHQPTTKHNSSTQRPQKHKKKKHHNQQPQLTNHIDPKLSNFTNSNDSKLFINLDNTTPVNNPINVSPVKTAANRHHIMNIIGPSTLCNENPNYITNNSSAGNNMVYGNIKMGDFHETQQKCFLQQQQQ